MLKRVLLSICACAAFAAVLSAQTGVGQIQGTITDTSGAVIPNAAVMLDHPDGKRFRPQPIQPGSTCFPPAAGEYRLE